MVLWEMTSVVHKTLLQWSAGASQTERRYTGATNMNIGLSLVCVCMCFCLPACSGQIELNCQEKWERVMGKGDSVLDMSGNDSKQTNLSRK